MKTFFDYLSESNKVYQFKIAVAGDNQDGLAERLKAVLEKFGVSKMSTGKRTPIQETPLEFPQLSNTEVTYFDVDVKYPSIPAMIEEHIAHTCNIQRSHVHVRNFQDPINISFENQKPKSETYQTLLDNPEMGGESAQNMAGQNRVMDLLKELEIARKEHPYDPIAGISTKKQKSQPLGEK